MGEPGSMRHDLTDAGIVPLLPQSGVNSIFRSTKQKGFPDATKPPESIPAAL